MTLWPSDKVKTIFGLVLMFIQFFIPVMVLIICYSKIVWVLTRRINTDLMKTKSAIDNSEFPGAKVNNSIQVKDTGKDKFELARRNTIKTLLTVGICFIICWSQNQVRYFLYNCGYEIDFNSTYHLFTVLMVFLNCTVNPFIYLVKYRDYQQALKIFFHCKKTQESKNSLNPSVMQTSNSVMMTNSQ